MTQTLNAKKIVNQPSLNDNRENGAFGMLQAFMKVLGCAGDER